ncbi:MAG: thioredoxin family protein [Chitinophagaceae bacterium]
MRFFSVLFAGLLLISSIGWEHDFDSAMQKAKQEHKLILLNFSGSDWCIPCIRLHKEIFETNTFKQFADSNLVLVNADFPRLKKNQLSKEQQKKNDMLADKYNAQGSFPFTVLIDETGKVVKAWDGFPNMTPEQFAIQLKTYLDARN